MDKVALKTTLIKGHQETLQRLRDEYASYQSGGDLNLEDVRDADDNSHREQACGPLHEKSRCSGNRINSVIV